MFIRTKAPANSALSRSSPHSMAMEGDSRGAPAAWRRGAPLLPPSAPKHSRAAASASASGLVDGLEDDHVTASSQTRQIRVPKVDYGDVKKVADVGDLGLCVLRMLGCPSGERSTDMLNVSGAMHVDPPANGVVESFPSRIEPTKLRPLKLRY